MLPTLSCKQMAGLNVKRRPLIARVQQQVQQHQMPVMAREARTVGLRQADVPQSQRQRAQSCPVIPQLPSTKLTLSYFQAHTVCGETAAAGLIMKLWQCQQVAH